MPSKAIHNELPCAIDWLETDEMAAFAVPVRPMSPMIPATRAGVIFDFIIYSVVWYERGPWTGEIPPRASTVVDEQKSRRFQLFGTNVVNYVTNVANRWILGGLGGG